MTERQDQPSASTAETTSLYARLTEGLILPLFYGISGNPALTLYRELADSEWWSRNRLEQEQRRRIRLMLEHAWDSIPFYRKRFESLGAERSDLAAPGFLEQVPPLTKQQVIAHGEQFVDTSNPRSLHWTTTGGSTGETVRFCHDRDSLGDIKARVMRAHHWAGFHEGERVARLWGSPMERAQAYSLRQRVLRRIKNTLFLDGYDLSQATMADYACRLRAFRPKVIIAFTTCLHILTRYMEERGIAGVRPRAIITTSSPLYPSYRAQFERFYGCPVFDEYGSREFGSMAAECPQQKLHLNIEAVHISVMRAGGRLPDGEAGDLLVTGLFNRAFPLIRYPIGDLGRYTTQACSCGRGSPLLEIVKGRSSEVLMGPRGIPVLGEFFIDLFDELPGEVRRFRIYQSGPTNLRMHLVTPGPLGDSSQALILRAIAGKFGDEMQVELVYVDEIGPLPSGKHLLTINETSPSFANRASSTDAG